MRGDELADVRCDGHVVLRAVRAVARDVDWATAWPREVAVTVDGDSLTLDLRIHDLGLDLAGSLRVAADGDSLRINLDLEALGASPTNRVGLVVLHPPHLAGTPLQVTHPDGATSALAFPQQVSPHQPARDIAGLAWESGTPAGEAGGFALRLALEGDVFEMEDQRNWTDASYKTYSRPLDLPFPYTLAAGEHVGQSLVLTASPSADEVGASSQAAPASAAPSAAEPGPAADPAPVAEPAPGEELTWHRGGAVPAIGTGHLNLELADPDWPQRLDTALEAHPDLALWIACPSPADPSALAELGRRLRAAVAGGARPRFVGIADAARHVTTPELDAALRAVVPAGLPVVAGARSHFTELNREWDTVFAAEPSALAFATTPLFHTLETEQLLEAVAMQRLLAEQVTARAPGLPVHVGPISLRPRFANVATSPQPVPAPAPPADPRAGTALHEAWTVASAAALSVPGIASLTYEQVPAPLAALGRAENALLTGRSVDGLVWAIGDGRTLLLANLASRPRRVHVPDARAPLHLDPVSWRTL
ncbi:hypothetical protein [Brachybacterium saurashtrense]|uniref:hypothetical protein n=1 Tax=Brachybacterium saurashtrense TaxID=556288 RepID=UPI0013B402AA|nr:hypothetical protein [Brachybacterium saurashtrense]